MLRISADVVRVLIGREGWEDQEGQEGQEGRESLESRESQDGREESGREGAQRGRARPQRGHARTTPAGRGAKVHSHLLGVTGALLAFPILLAFPGALAVHSLPAILAILAILAFPALTALLPFPVSYAVAHVSALRTMSRTRLSRLVMLAASLAALTAAAPLAQAPAAVRRVPTFRVDPFWPKPLPNHWILGAVAGVAVDARDHVWLTHRPSTLQPNETRSIWKAAPPVLEFDANGNLVSSWGGPGTGYEWPQLEHGILVDGQNVWLGAGGDKDAHILKFTRQGRFLMQIGHQGKGQGSNDTDNLGAPANIELDRDANELYVADGYVNHRVIVFDATTGAYKRHWGAYGNRPDDGWFTRQGEKLPGPFSGAVQNEVRPSQYDPNGPPAPQFRIVHAVRISKDGLVYVCDRTNDRLQVFKKDGTFVREQVLAKDTFGSGSVWDVVFSTDPQQQFIFVNDGTNQLIYVLDRQTLEIVSTFGGHGHMAGQFYGAHVMAGNSRGDLFVGETYEGKRLQKFTYVGLGAPSTAP